MTLVVLTAFIISLGAAQEPVRVAANGAGVIAGQVVDATSGLPVAGATVALSTVGRVVIEATIDADGSVTNVHTPRVVVDSQGRFVFAALRAGTYDVSATAPAGYAQALASVDLGADERATDVAMSMRRHGSISGTVRDDAGDSVAGAPVSAFLRTMFLARPVLLPKGGATADDRGQFRIPDLPAGEYVICVCSDHSLPFDTNLLPRLGPRPPSAAALTQRLVHFAPMFHPRSTVPSGATPIRLGVADDRADIDITVNVAAPVRVSGQLQGVTVNASTEMTLLLVPENDLQTLGATALSPVQVTADGAFEFAGVPPGRYSIEAFPKNPRKGLWTSMPIAVGESDIADLAVALRSGAAISGRLEFSGASTRPAPATLEQSQVTLLPVDSTPRLIQSGGTAMLISPSATVNREGMFRIENLPPGRYAVSTSSIGPWRVDTSDALVTVSDSDVTGIMITMSDVAFARLEVAVELDRYESPQQVRVMVFPADTATWAEPFRHTGRFYLSSSSTRTFRFPSVPAGDYYVTRDTADMNLTIESLELLSRRATRVTLRPGDITAVLLKR